MKRRVSGVLLLVCFMLSVLPVGAAAKTINVNAKASAVKVNNTLMQFDNFLYNNAVYVQPQDICAAMNLGYTYNAAKKTIQFSNVPPKVRVQPPKALFSTAKAGTSIKISSGTLTLTTNTDGVAGKLNAITYNNAIFVSVKDLAAVLGKDYTASADLKTITVNEKKPPNPVLKPNTTTTSNMNVVVTISNWGNAVKKEYKLGDGDWTAYTAPVTVLKNTIIYARGTNVLNVASNIVQLDIKNIKVADPLQPVIKPSTTAVTDKDVTVTIDNWGTAVSKECRVGDGPWKPYTAPFTVASNTIVYARGTNQLDITSNVASLKISNIRKLLTKQDIAKLNTSTVKIFVFDINGNVIGNASGVIVSSDGLVVTNYHVIDMIPKAVVITSDDEYYDVEGVTAYDVSRDLAVLKLSGASNLKPAVLGNSDLISLGEEIVAIGYPLNQPLTVTYGNVSSIKTPGGLYRKDRQDIQISAPINSGNSGGPMLNMYGEVVGINYSSISNSQNLNFSIPINEVKPMLSSKSVKSLAAVLKEVYPVFKTYNDFEAYLYCNYPDVKAGENLLSFTNIYLLQSEDDQNELFTVLSLNPYKYGELLLADADGKRKDIENWINGIYLKIKEQYPDKVIYIAVYLDAGFNDKPVGYTDKEVAYNNQTGMWEVSKLKIVYSSDAAGALHFEWR